MLRHVQEYEKYVEVTGFKEVSFEDAEELLKAIRREKHQTVSIQFFDAELVATWEHLYFAVLNALVAFRNRRKISKNLSMEVMLYASAQRQIRKAVELIGVKRGSSNVAVTIVGEDPDVVKTAFSAVSEHLSKKPDESVLELSTTKLPKIRGAFGISETEIETIKEKDKDYVERVVVDLVIERMALLSTQL